MNAQQVVDIFVEQQVLPSSQVEDILQEARFNGKTIEQALVDSGFVDQRTFYQVIADALGTEFVELAEDDIAPEILRLIPGGLARLHRALPVAVSDHSLSVALVDPFDLRAAEDLRFALGKDINVVVAAAPQSKIASLATTARTARAWRTSSGSWVKPTSCLLCAATDESASAVEAEANATPIIRFVDLILLQAIQDRASDIHFEPFENEFKIRYRVDGALYEMAPPPRHLALPVISRVKVMANMNIAERRLPQDGSIQKNVAGRSVDLRVSTLPTQFGESVVLRVLDRSTRQSRSRGARAPRFHP